MNATGAYVALAVGTVLAGYVVWRIKSGVSFDTRRPARVIRKDDTFSFWPSLIFPAGLAIVLLAGGVIGLWHTLQPN